MSCSYDDTMKMWVDDEDDWFCAETLAGHTSTVWDASFNSSGTHLASVSEDKSLIIWRYVEPGKKPSSVDDLCVWFYLLERLRPNSIYKPTPQQAKLVKNNNIYSWPHKGDI